MYICCTVTHITACSAFKPVVLCRRVHERNLTWKYSNLLFRHIFTK